MTVRAKYGNKRTVLDGHSFASQAEARYYAGLKLLERAGQIRELELQPQFPIEINGVKVFTYVADFAYWEDETRHVVDVKGFSTDVFKLKKKAVEAEYGITIEIVRA